MVVGTSDLLSVPRYEANLMTLATTVTINPILATQFCEDRSSRQQIRGQAMQ